MDIEQKKEAFYNLLRAHLETNGDEEIWLSDSTLEENSLNGRMFWEVICPLFQTQGKLKEFDDPESSQSKLNVLVYSMSEYKAEREKLDLLEDFATGGPRAGGVRWHIELNKTNKKTLEELMDDSKARMEAITAKYRKKYRHKFIVAREKFLSPKSAGTPQHIVIDDTPEDTSWRSLQLRFIDRRTLHASIPSKSWAKNGIECKQLGLEKKIGGRPKEQWLLLEEAATHNGQIKLTSSKKEGKKKQINSLKVLLRAVFPKLKGEPIESVGRDAYQIAFEILPEQKEERSYFE